MRSKVTRQTFRISGMTCAGCEQKIERILGKIRGIHEVRASFSSNAVSVSYDSSLVDRETMSRALEKAGYAMEAAPGGDEKSSDGRAFTLSQFLGIAIILAAIYLVVKNTVGFDYIPEVTQTMGYGMLFVVGLLTSLHCVAMCGGINLSQCIEQSDRDDAGRARLRPSILYNLGRIVSYTVIGGIVGAIGAAVSFSGWARGIVAIASGLFMVVMGLSMMGIFPWLNKIAPRMPRFLQRKAGEAGRGKGPFIVGLLNGLMPCGPLQSMQLYALGTGSALTGAASMFVFSLGTTPLMFGLGALSSLLSRRFTANMMKISAVLVLALGLLMTNRGFALSGVALLPKQADSGAPTAESAPSSDAVQSDSDVQIVTNQLKAGGYPSFTVTKGKPVRWILKADAKDLNGCNSAIVIPKFNIQKRLKPGENIIEFTPTETGAIPYSCWMGMITARINVVEEQADSGSTVEPQAQEGQEAIPDADSAGASCCAAGSLATRFADGKVPTDEIAVAQVVNGVQQVTITVDDEGYTPAAAVVQKGIKTVIRFETKKLNGCNSYVVFPQYNGALDLSSGEIQTPVLEPEADFTFECGMGMLHGYVKVVDDLKKIDLNSIKSEIDAYTPASSGGSCCG